MRSDSSDEKIWVELAELFFLDTEFDERDFERIAKLLKDSGWSRERTEKTLVQLIAPHVAGNLGHLFWPVIGEWAGFDHDWLCARVRHSKILRTKHPDWYFMISDWWCRKMLRQLDVERLLSRL